MAVYTIGDLHLSLGGNKPMDVFGGWQDYVPRLQANWRQTVGKEDTVVLLGDISWAMHLEDCAEDFAFIQALPGRKFLVKGNHDYWWSTRAKMDRYLEEKGFTSLSFIHNSCALADGLALCGTRSWMYEPGVALDDKVMAREAGRLEASLKQAQQQAPQAEKVAFLHYPPVFPGSCAAPMVDLMAQYGVRRCYYGHLHGASIPRAVQGRVQGIHYRLVSADAVGFCPVLVQQQAFTDAPQKDTE